MGYKWSWMGDNGWIPFDAKKSADLEKGFNTKAKSVTLDKERFVDLSLSYAEVCKNFTNLTDKALIGIQRRFDDHMKRRAVKREKDDSEDEFFEDKEFVFLDQLLGKKLKAKDQELIDSVKTHGGKVSAALSKTVDYLILGHPIPTNASPETIKAEGLGAQILSSNFVSQCILQSKLVETKSYIVKLEPLEGGGDDEEEEEEEEEKPKAKGKGKAKVAAKKAAPAKKKKAESEEEEEEEDEKPKAKDKKAAKKRKADDDEEEEDEDEDEKKAKKAKTDDKKPASNGSSSSIVPPAPVNTPNGLLVLQPGSEWMGVCTDAESGSHFPFLLQVAKVENTTFEGFIFWKTLGDAQTKFRGKFAPNGHGGDLNVDLEEYEAVTGADEVELPMTYSGALSGKTISGKVGDKDSKSTFKVDLIKNPPFKLRAPLSYAGACKADTPFTLKVVSRDDEEVSGTITWQVAPPTVTRWKGVINDLSLSLEEYEVVSGDKDFFLRTWNLSVTDDEALSVTNADRETFVVPLSKA